MPQIGELLSTIRIEELSTTYFSDIIDSESTTNANSLLKSYVLCPTFTPL
jgi:hypothetical protein